MKFMKGHKTWAAGLGMIGIGIFQIVKGMDIESGIMRISEGLAIIGIGHKIEKAAQ